MPSPMPWRAKETTTFSSPNCTVSQGRLRGRGGSSGSEFKGLELGTEGRGTGAHTLVLDMLLIAGDRITGQSDAQFSEYLAVHIGELDCAVHLASIEERKHRQGLLAVLVHGAGH